MLLEQMHCQLWNQFILFLNKKGYVLVLTMEFIINVKIADLNNNLFCDAPQECMTVLTGTCESCDNLLNFSLHRLNKDVHNPIKLFSYGF